MHLCAATDLSPAAAPAVELALRWARAMNATVTLLHVVHDPVLAPALSSDTPGDAAAARRELQAIADANADVVCHVDVRTAEDVAQAIVAAAVAGRTHFLFVGSHGRSALQRLRLGSVATAVVRASSVPVVCLPPPR